jgi:hypothetical protein
MDNQPIQTMSETEQLKAQIAALQAEIAARKASKRAPKGTLLANGISAQVSEKGAVSVYGLSRFPVTLYASQWLELLPVASHLISFIKANEGKLSVKMPKTPQPPKAV